MFQLRKVPRVFRSFSGMRFAPLVLCAYAGVEVATIIPCLILNDARALSLMRILQLEDFTTPVFFGCEGNCCAWNARK